MAVSKTILSPESEEFEGTDPSPQTRVLKVVRGLASDEGSVQFDRIIHERIRLAIISALSVNVSLTFSDLKQLLSVTDGNLSVHARKLEDAKYITARKFFEGRVPKTEFKITAKGRRSLQAYLEHMESLIQAMRTEQ